MPQPALPAATLAQLQRQFNQELSAAHGYHAVATWCSVQNLPGCAAFFAKQAGEERIHAQKIIDHLVDRGAQPAFGPIPAPRGEFDSLLAVAQLAETMEQANTAGIHGVYEAALADKDYPAQVLMHWFINEQVEEESWAAEFIARVQGALCAGSLAALDRHVMDLLADDEEDGD